MNTFTNTNGNIYDVRDVFELKGHTIALLQSQTKNEYVIANGLNEQNWDNGRYLPDGERANYLFKETVLSAVLTNLGRESEAYIANSAFRSVVEGGEAQCDFTYTEFLEDLGHYFTETNIELSESDEWRAWEDFGDIIANVPSVSDLDESYYGTLNVNVYYDHLYDEEIGASLGDFPRLILGTEQTIEQTVSYLQYFESLSYCDELVLESVKLDQVLPKLVDNLKKYPDQDIEYAKEKYPDVPIMAIQEAYNDNFTNANLAQDPYMKLFALANDMDTPIHVLHELAAMDVDGISDEAMMNQNFDQTKDLFDFCDIDINKIDISNDKNNEMER